MNKLFFNLGDAASKLGVRREVVNNLIDSGLLPTVTVGKRQLIRRADFDKFVTETTGR